MPDEHDQHAAPAGDAHGDGHDDGHKKKHGGHGGHKHGGGHAEHEEGVPEWVVSFADNALLQMGFFVILFAMNVGPKATQAGGGDGSAAGASDGYLDMAISIREAFNVPVSLDSKDPKDLPLIRRMLERGIEGHGRQPGPKGEKPEVQALRPTDYADVTAQVPFDQNEARVSGDSRQTLADVARELKGQRWIIEVRGHCSSIEAQGDVGIAMRLCYDRAAAVAAILVEHGMTWHQLRLTASADNERVTAVAYDSAAHRSNQRVEIVVTKDQMAPDPFTVETGQPAITLPAP